MMKQIILLAACIFVCSAAFAQKTTAAAKKNKANANAIGGFIRDGRNHPLADVQAFIYNKDSSIAASGYTDATGFFETNAVAPGKYDLKVVYPSNKIVMVTGVAIKHGVAMVNLSMDEPSADTAIAYTDLVPKPVKNAAKKQ